MKFIAFFVQLIGDGPCIPSWYALSSPSPCICIWNHVPCSLFHFTGFCACCTRRALYYSMGAGTRWLKPKIFINQALSSHWARSGRPGAVELEVVAGNNTYKILTACVNDVSG